MGKKIIIIIFHFLAIDLNFGLPIPSDVEAKSFRDHKLFQSLSQKDCWIYLTVFLERCQKNVRLIIKVGSDISKFGQPFPYSADSDAIPTYV